MSNDKEPTVTVPTISRAEIAQAIEGAASHAKALFLRGLPDEAHKVAHFALALADEIGHAAATPLADLKALFGKFRPAAEADAAAAWHALESRVTALEIAARCAAYTPPMPPPFLPRGDRASPPPASGSADPASAAPASGAGELAPPPSASAADPNT